MEDGRARPSVVLSIGLGPWMFGASGPERFFGFVDRAEALRLDSIWLSDRVVSRRDAPATVLDPLIALAGVAARTRWLKLGTSIYVLPLRNPVLAAKEMATLDFLSNGRLLLAFGVGVEGEREYEACGAPKSERGSRLDEAIVVMRRLWSEEHVTHEGRHFRLRDIRIDPKPLGPMPIWLGGRSEAALARVGRLCDGWLPSTITPREVAEGIQRIQAYAAEAGREIDDDHFGALLTFSVAASREKALRQAAPYLIHNRADEPPQHFAALGTLRDCWATLQEYVDAGATKFVLRPAAPPEGMLEQLEAVAELQQLLA